MKEPKVFLAVPKVMTLIEAESKDLPSVDECPYVAVVSFYAAKRHDDETEEEAGKSIVPEFAQLYGSSLEELEKVTIELIQSSFLQLKESIQNKG